MGKRRQFFLFFVCAVFAFGYAYSRVKFFLPVELVVEGQAVFPGQLNLQWNSGRGFNILEQKDVALSPLVSRELTVTRTGKHNKVSQGSDIWIQSVESGIPAELTLEGLALEQHLQVDDFWGTKIIRLTESSPVLKIKTTAQKLKVNFLTTSSSGGVTLSGFSDKEEQIDLFSVSRGSLVKVASESDAPPQCFTSGCRFRSQVPLSPDEIRELKLRSNVLLKDLSLAFSSSNGILKIPLATIDGSSFDIKTSGSGNEIFSGVLVGTQVFFSLVIGLLGVVAMKHLPPISQWFSARFRAFWYLWCTFLSTLCFWWFAYWPIALSPDSLFTWRTARRLNFYDDSHPFLNVFYVLCLRQLWDDPAVISLFQILLTSTLAAGIFFYCLRRGVNSTLVYGSAALFALSVPVGLYSITLWRDIPFALLMVGWAFLLAVLKDNPKFQRKINTPELMLLSLSLAFLMLRHNGKLTVVLIPALVFILGLIPKMKALGLVACTALLFYLSQVVLKTHVLKIYFLYPEGIIQGWRNELTPTAVIAKFGKTILGFLNTLDINMNWRETNVWRGSWGNVASYETFKYTADVDAGFIKYEPLVLAINDIAETILTYSYKLPLVFFEWNPLLFLYLFIPPLVLFLKFPRSSIFSFIITSQTVALIFFTGSINWRYFYFQCLACYFILPIILLDKPNFLSSVLLPRRVKVLAGIGLLFLGAEVFFAYHPGDVTLRRELEAQSGPKRLVELSYYLPFSTPVSAEVVDPEDASKRYLFDGYGMRVKKQPPVDEAPGAYKVMLLGDEVLFGRGVDFDSSIAGRLSLLQGELSRPVKFLNGALTGGGSPDSYYAYLSGQGFAFQPNMIVLFVSPDDDLSDISTNSWSRLDAEGGALVVSSNLLQRDLNGKLLNISSLPWTYRLSWWSESRVLMNLMAPLSSYAFGTDISKGLTRKPLTADESFNRLVTTLKALRKTARSQGISLVTVVLPGGQKDGGVSPASRRVLEVLKRVSIPRVDLTTKIGPIQRTSDGSVALSAKDSAAVADGIMAYLQEYDAKRGL